MLDSTDMQIIDELRYIHMVRTSSLTSFIHNKYKISGEGCCILECKFPSNVILDDFLNGLNKDANYKLSIVIGK